MTYQEFIALSPLIGCIFIGLTFMFGRRDRNRDSEKDVHRAEIDSAEKLRVADKQEIETQHAKDMAELKKYLDKLEEINARRHHDNKVINGATADGVHTALLKLTVLETWKDGHEKSDLRHAQDLRDLKTDVAKLGTDVGGALQNVREEVRNIKDCTRKD